MKSSTKKDSYKLMHLLPASFDCLFQGAYKENLRRDIFAGITVGIVALPLAMAFAIASGLPPERGLFTAVVAGFLISTLGGSRIQIGGPTGAFVVIVYDIVLRHGYEGLVVATLTAGLLLVIAGLTGFGKMIKFIPYPVTTGFTTGIALIIFSSQVKDFFGFTTEKLPAGFMDKWIIYFQEIGTVNHEALMVGFVSLMILLAVRKYSAKIPGPLVAIVFASILVKSFDIEIETIGTMFNGIPHMLPMPKLPEVNIVMFKELFPDAVTIAILAGIESLLSAVVADGMTGFRHKSDCELVGLGIANIGSALFGGIPATGAIARTATSVKSGGRTPLAGIVHSITVLLVMMLFAPLAASIPLASLAAVLFVVAWNMSELDHFRHMFKAPASDSAVMVAVFLLTIFTDLTIAVQTGVVLASLLFIKRISEVSDTVRSVKILEESELPEDDDPDAIFKKDLPVGVEVYEINGPFFFGVADTLKGVLDGLEPPPKVLILRMRRVPVIDATAIHALEEFHSKCIRGDTILILSGVRDNLRKVLRRAGVERLVGSENILPNINIAIERSIEIVPIASN